MTDVRWVLVAEDDDDIRAIICKSLADDSEGLNLQVVEAKDGLEAISKAATREFQCVVTDLRMPRSTGVELLHALQSQPLNANTPTLVISGYADDQVFTEKFSHIRVIPKPFEPQEVARAVVREIKLGRMDDRVAAHLMNPFLDSIQTMLTDELKIKPTLQPPQVKKPGEIPAGDVFCTMTLSTGHLKSRFSLGFDRTLLEFARNNYYATRLPNGSSQAPEVIVRQICLAIFEKAAPHLSKVMGNTVRMTGTSVVLNQGKNEPEYAELVRMPGIMVVANTDQGRMVAGAFAKPKSRRGT
jgi:two-component system chemotaxis response regulator CheY